MRDLPPLDELAGLLRGELDADGVVVVAGGDYPAVGFVFDGHLPVLLRDHGTSLTLSLPHDTSLHLVTRTQWADQRQGFRAALVAHRRSGSCPSLADAVVALVPRLGGKFTVRFPGTPVPSEAWLADEDAHVGLFQEAASVRVVVWVGGSMRSNALKGGTDLEALARWVTAQLAEQAKANAARGAEEARIAALPIPSLATVVTALKAGKRIVVGGGRSSETYFWQDGLKQESMDEGWYETRAIDDETLAGAIRLSPDPFRKSLE